MNRKLIIAITLLLFMIISGLSIYLLQKQEISEETDIHDWQIYKNEEYGFEVKYPAGWVVEKINWNRYAYNGLGSIMFGPQESTEGGLIWGIEIYQKDKDTILQKEQIIASIGKQFDDRKEERKTIVIDSKESLFIIVTTNQHKDWVSETVLLETKDKIYVIGNGATTRKDFEIFYNNFHFID